MKLSSELSSANLFKNAFFSSWTLLGSLLASVLLVVFLFGADEPNPAWPSNWMLRPAFVLPLAGAAGGFITALLLGLVQLKRIPRLFAIVTSIFVFLLALWMGMVLGFVGTYWN